VEHFDAASPPLSWAFWDHNEVSTPEYVKELARPHPRAVAGHLLGFNFNASTLVFELRIQGCTRTP
jgi:hypothetical protein